MRASGAAPNGVLRSRHTPTTPRPQDAGGAADPGTPTRGRKPGDTRRPHTPWVRVRALSVLWYNAAFVVGMAAVLGPLWLAFPGPAARNAVRKVVGVVIVTEALGLFDLALARHSRARYMVIHAFANAIVAVVATPDTLEAFADPVNSLNGRCSMVPAYVVPAIHIYHLIAFRNLTVGDYVHHALFCGIICPIGLFMEAGVAQNAVGWFMCGLPGGLDFLMLAVRRPVP